MLGNRLDDDIAYIEDLGLVDAKAGHLQIANGGLLDMGYRTSKVFSPEFGLFCATKTAVVTHVRH